MTAAGGFNETRAALGEEKGLGLEAIEDGFSVFSSKLSADLDFIPLLIDPTLKWFEDLSVYSFRSYLARIKVSTALKYEQRNEKVFSSFAGNGFPY